MRVNVKEYKQIVGFVSQMKQAHKINIPLWIWGNHGVGKTQCTGQVASEMDYEYRVLNLANQTPEELMGHPNGKGGYHTPAWFIESKKPVLYFLDEINRAPKYVLQSMFNFINEGRINDVSIKPEDIIIAAGNPDCNDYEVTSFEDKAFLSRFCHLYLEPETDEVLKYYAKTNVNDIISEVLRDDPGVLNLTVPDNAILPVKPDSRMMWRLGQILNVITEPQVSEFGYSLFSGMVGTDIASIIVNKFKNTKKIPDPMEILTGKYDLKKIDPSRLDIINVLTVKLIGTMLDKGYIKKPEPIAQHISKYLKAIPRDATLAFVKEMMIKGITKGEVSVFFKAIDEFKLLSNILEAQVTVK